MNKMVLIFTGNEQLDNDLNKKIRNSRVVYYPDYVLEENDATALIISVQPNKFNFKEFMFKVRQKDIQVILILENENQEELKTALTLGIYDIIFDPFDLDEVYKKINKPNTFSIVSKYIKELLELENI